MRSFLPPLKKTTQLTIGTATAIAGEIVYGSFAGVPLPTGGTDDFPVIIAHGKQDGPVLWITAGIHGNEYTGITVIHTLFRWLGPLLPKLRGAVVAIPALNPAGLRLGERRSYHFKHQDPNRLFPANRRSSSLITGAHPSDPEPPSALEMAYGRLYQSIVDTATYLIDLHNYSPQSLPFAFRDPIGYTDEADKIAARQLLVTLEGMLSAFGHTIINEYVTADYFKRGLHRSVSGAVLNTARVPAFTVELGGYLTVEQPIVQSATTGLRNVLRWANMLEGDFEPITSVPILKPAYPIRRMQHPHAPMSGIVEFLVNSGDPLRKGMPVARLTDMWGRPITPSGTIQSEHDGFVLGVLQGAMFYQNELLMNIAVRDDRDMLVPI